MSTQNKAAWLTAEKQPFVVKDAPYPSPGPNDLVINAGAWSVIPYDNLIAKDAMIPTEYPKIMGGDVAGTVVAVGAAVKRFKPGDRVASFAPHTVTQDNADAAFQLYPRVTEDQSYTLPAGVDFAHGATIPVALSTAAVFLYDAKFLGLPLPSLTPVEQKGKAVLIWGGSSTVGAMAIQLARLSGITVVSTASPANFDLVRSLGAAAVLDRNSASVVDDVVAALEGKELLGAFNASGGQATQPAHAVLRLAGRKFVGTTQPMFAPSPDGVEVKFGTLGDLVGTPLGAQMGVFGTEAIAKGALKMAIEPRVVGTGLESIQAAADVLYRGVSASKIVVLA